MVQTLFNVGMTCEGCSRAVTRILNKIDGVSGVVTSVEDKLVTVEHEERVEKNTMLEALMKWSAASGKSVELKA